MRSFFIKGRVIENGHWWIMDLENTFQLSQEIRTKLLIYPWNRMVERWDHCQCLTLTLNVRGYVIWSVILEVTIWWKLVKNLNLLIGQVRGLISSVVLNTFDGKLLIVLFIWQLNSCFFSCYSGLVFDSLGHHFFVVNMGIILLLKHWILLLEFFLESWGVDGLLL